MNLILNNFLHILTPSKVEVIIKLEKIQELYLIGERYYFKDMDFPWMKYINSRMNAKYPISSKNTFKIDIIKIINQYNDITELLMDIPELMLL